MRKNIYKVEQEPLTEYDELYWAMHRAMLRAFNLFKRVGLRDVSSSDFTVHGQDTEFILTAMLEHFQAFELYERCFFIKKLLDDLAEMKKANQP